MRLILFLFLVSSVDCKYSYLEIEVFFFGEIVFISIFNGLVNIIFRKLSNYRLRNNENK